MTLEDSRIAKNIYAKGNWKERAKGIPTIPEMYENATSYVDLKKLVYFNRNAIKQKKEINEQRTNKELIDLFKNFSISK